MMGTVSIILHWHHRVLFHRVDAGDWITLTPDLEFQRHNLATHNHSVLERNTPFPGDISDEIYAHDPLSNAQLEAFKRQSRIMAAVLGEGAVDELETVAWVVADPSHADFGKTVDAQLLHNEATGLALMTFHDARCNEGSHAFWLAAVLRADLAWFESSVGAQLPRAFCRSQSWHRRRQLEVVFSLQLLRPQWAPRMLDHPKAVRALRPRLLRCLMLT